MKFLVAEADRMFSDTLLRAAFTVNQDCTVDALPLWLCARNYFDDLRDEYAAIIIGDSLPDFPSQIEIEEIIERAGDVPVAVSVDWDAPGWFRESLLEAGARAILNRKTGVDVIEMALRGLIDG